MSYRKILSAKNMDGSDLLFSELLVLISVYDQFDDGSSAAAPPRVFQLVPRILSRSQSLDE